MPLAGFCDGPFWDPSLLNSTSPDLTVCFQKSVLALVPCAYLWVVAPFYIYHVKKHSRGHIKVSRLHRAKTICNILLLVLPFVSLFTALHYSAKGHYIPGVDILTPTVLCLTIMLIFVLIQLERLKGVQSSGVLFIFWFLATCVGIVALRSDILQVINSANTSTTPIVVHFLYYILILIMLILTCMSDNPPHRAPKVTDLNPCPETSASFLSKITFWWFTGLVIRGYKKPLEREDLWSLNAEDAAGSVFPKFEREWQKEKCRAYRAKTGTGSGNEAKKPLIRFRKFREKDPCGKITDCEDFEVAIREGRKETVSAKASLLWAICCTFSGTFLFGSFLKLLQDMMLFINPYLLKLMINFTADKSIYTWQGYMYAGLMFGNALFQSLILHQYFHICFVVGMRLRTVVISAVYRKALSLTNDARKSSTVGEIVNLMSVDAQRLMDLTAYFNMLWSAPLQIAVALYFLWDLLGPSVLAGLGVMVLMIPINAAIATKTRSLQVKQMKHKDSRIKLMNEILNGIKILKLYAWEESFMKNILGIREKELVVLRRASYLNAISSFFWNCAPFLVSLTTFGVYVSVSDKNVLDAEKAFVSLSLFNILRFPLTMLPFLISSIVQAQVSMKRLQKFMKHQELDPNNVTHSNKAGKAISVERGVFSWGQEDEPVLNEIDLDIDQGSLVAVVGQVGSGKSSMISAFLGDMEKQDGQVFVKGSIAYVPQQAWIQNATLQDNVLFGSEMNASKYNKVVDACALGPDIQALPGGNLTEIGEKGINLSGGQKQRVSLARAVYSNSDVYLLDDPLSAVDAHVGKHIFDNVIGPDGLLKNKTRVLVTHGITFLPQVDKIIVLVGGRITETGSFQELLDRDGAFAEFLRNYSADADSEEDQEGDPTVLSINEEVLSKMSDCKSLSTLSIGDDVGETNLTGKRTADTVSQLDSMSLAKRIPLGKHLKEGEKKHLKEDDAGHDEEKKLIKKETSETGRVAFSVFWAYIKSMSVFLSVLICLLYMAQNAAGVASNIWLSRWSEEPVINGTQDPSIRSKYLGVYGALGIGQGILVFISSLSLAIAALRASTSLHSHILKTIMWCPMSFFDVTPLGRVLNRFAKDIDTIDLVLPRSVSTFLSTLVGAVSSLLVICISTPIFTAIILPMAIMFALIQRFYIATSRQLKRLESVSRSPIYSHFSETITGVSTIRAYGQQKRFIGQNEHKIDENQITYYPNICSNRWLALRLEFIGNCIVFFAALFAVIGRDSLNGGIVGLSITYALQITSTLNWLVRMSSELETNIVSVERVKEYAEIPTEAAAIVPNNRPSDDWPKTGKVDFVDYSTRYREDLDLVVKGITLSIQPGEKIGIVGRTGAGKSSLTLALFRIIEAAGGSIVIDGVNISKIGLYDLRSRITIIPQDPVLFAGSLRMNLDPFDQYSDDDVWKALELSHLSDFVSGLADGLQFECAEGGENLSVGQRQLICLARALLRKSRILVLDEATAAVDLETDDLIQATIRTQFADCTVFTIAHRLNTIMDSTRVLVLDKGEIAEFNTPIELLTSQGIFYSMAKDAGLAA
ncbi:multidrug resistance-associated protein 1-like isoform X1 [Ptychodera flava]|uniref:multidrug resistance-associated protein 1-like isoform X1 n=1 Tax=Ptychodera flava TaxID=63121 RepID=UPI00396A4F31